ncbi:GTP-binding protein, partial [archaeon]
MLHIRRLPFHINVASVVAGSKSQQFSSMSEIVKALEKERIVLSEQKEKKFSASLHGLNLDFSKATTASAATVAKPSSSLRDLFKKAEMSRATPNNTASPAQTATEAIKKDILKTLSSSSHLSPISELEVDEMTEGEKRFLQKQQKVKINRHNLEDKLGYSPREAKEKDRLDQAMTKAMKNSVSSVAINGNKSPASKQEKVVDAAARPASAVDSTMTKQAGVAPSTAPASQPATKLINVPPKQQVAATQFSQSKQPSQAQSSVQSVDTNPVSKATIGAQSSPKKWAGHPNSSSQHPVPPASKQQAQALLEEIRMQQAPQPVINSQSIKAAAAASPAQVSRSSTVQQPAQQARAATGSQQRTPAGNQHGQQRDWQQQPYPHQRQHSGSNQPYHNNYSNNYYSQHPNRKGGGQNNNGYVPRPQYQGTQPYNNNYNNNYNGFSNSYQRFPRPMAMPDMFSDNTAVGSMEQFRPRFQRTHEGYKEVVPGRMESSSIVSKSSSGVREVVIPPDGLTVRDIARELALKIETVVEKVAALGEGQESMKHKFRGMRVSKIETKGIEDKQLDADVTELVVLELGYNSTRANVKERVDNRSRAQEDGVVLVPRPPMVTIMGHVDHGKTTLLDSLRSLGMKGTQAEQVQKDKKTKTSKKETGESSSEMEKLVEGEAGGITQKLSAFTVSYTPPDAPPLPVVIVDTPGHAAFSAMRHMGGGGADAIILVVALDSGIQPQTIEGIKLAHSNNIPLIVAFNKADKYGQSERKTVVNKLTQALTQYNVLTREMGGEVPAVLISGKTGLNIEELLKEVHILSGREKGVEGEETEAEGEVVALLQKKILVAPTGPAEGVLLDSYMEKGRGVVCSLVVTWGELQTGDHVVIGQTYGKVRALYDEKNNKINTATPGTVVKMLGLKELPPLSAPLICVDSEGEARKICERRAKLAELKELRARPNIQG